jgi:hypothetical protein
MKAPSKATLRRYGLTETDWYVMVPDDGCCPVCAVPPKNGKMVIDHEHVPRWKDKPPSERKRYVRGLLCSWCNFRLLRKGLTLERAKRIVAFLTRYADRKRLAVIEQVSRIKPPD